MKYGKVPITFNNNKILVMNEKEKGKFNLKI